MLIEFSVANYRSFREKVTLNMVAGNDKTTLPGNVVEIPAGRKPLRVLRAAAIYGANASGKSNLVKALLAMRNLVLFSADRSREGQPLAAEPFKLDPACAQAPSEFELVIVEDGERYIYGFTADAEKIYEERLLAGVVRSRLLFERRRGEPVRFGDSWRGSRQQPKVLSDSVLMLSFLSREKCSVGPVISWFNNRFWMDSHHPSTQSLMAAFVMILQTQPELKVDLLEFLNRADLGISGIKYSGGRAAEILGEDDLVLSPPEHVVLGESRDSAGDLRPWFSRLGSEGLEVLFDVYEEESAGSQRLFALAAPLLFTIMSHGVLVVDEFERALHPELLKYVLAWFNASLSCGQLIFTTHDAGLLDADEPLLRRDQIWFTEKAPDGASKLYSLWDFAPRKDENLRKGYLHGRYGAVPILSEVDRVAS
jgi:hypothetical protein